MANHLKVLSGSSTVDAATAAANLNTALAAEIVAAAPQSVRLVDTDSCFVYNTVDGSLFIEVGLVQFEG